MSDEGEQIGERLRAHGLRVTPQRRAIMAAFAGGQSEHWSADEVHERARRRVPEIGRGTVYSTLNELVRAGLIGVVGRSEAVRYEINVDGRHQHFRCRACGRLYDVYPDVARQLDPPDDGFVVESVTVTFEGTCAQCVELERAFAEAAATGDPHERDPHAREPEPAPVGQAEEVAYGAVESPLGTLIGAVTERGLVRLAFDGSGEEALVDWLERWVAPRVVEERGRLEDVQRQLDEYFSGRRRGFELAIDWSAAREPRRRRVLEEIAGIEYGERLTYRDVTEVVDAPGAGETAGEALGANPLAIVVPCHRVVRADGGLGGYVGGLERKRELLRLEREYDRA